MCADIIIFSCCFVDRALLIPCVVCKRQLSQAFYEQFLSPSCPPIGAIQSLLELVHSHTGLPWWASLAVTTAALRTVLTFPLMVYSMNNVSKLERLQPEIKNLSKELDAEVALAKAKFEWSDSIARHHFRINVCQIYWQCSVCNKLFTFKWFVSLFFSAGWRENGNGYMHVWC